MWSTDGTLLRGGEGEGELILFWKEKRHYSNATSNGRHFHAEIIIYNGVGALLIHPSGDI